MCNFAAYLIELYLHNHHLLMRKHLYLIIVSALLGSCQSPSDPKTTAAADVPVVDTAPTSNGVAAPTNNLPIDKKYALLNLEEAKALVQNPATAVVTVLARKDFAEWSKLIHPKKGVRFSPYLMVDTKKDMVFTAEQVKKFATDTQIYTWGVGDGSGEPIQKTAKDYISQWVYGRDYAQTTFIGYNQIFNKGNSINNIPDIYPNGISVDFYVPSKNKEIEMDWGSLIFVLEPYENEWYVTGVINNRWTI